MIFFSVCEKSDSKKKKRESCFLEIIYATLGEVRGIVKSVGHGKHFLFRVLILCHNININAEVKHIHRELSLHFAFLPSLHALLSRRKQRTR